MRFENVCIESIAVALPEEVWTSADIEERLRPLYERLRLPFGRLELMSGIRERRFWPAGMRPSAASAAAGRAVLAKSALAPEQIEAFLHAAVSRDMLEPATATFAHHQIGLGPSDAVAVLTHDVKFDEPAIVAALRRGCRYVGAVGSSKTQADRRARLLAAGVTESELARLRGPIGLDLGGRAPAETALAIMAEIVAERHDGSGVPLHQLRRAGAPG